MLLLMGGIVGVLFVNYPSSQTCDSRAMRVDQRQIRCILANFAGYYGRNDVQSHSGAAQPLDTDFLTNEKNGYRQIAKGL